MNRDGLGLSHYTMDPRPSGLSWIKTSVPTRNGRAEAQRVNVVTVSAITTLMSSAGHLGSWSLSAMASYETRMDQEVSRPQATSVTPHRAMQGQIIELSGTLEVRRLANQFLALSNPLVAFIDPFFSSGVHLACTGALSAAITIAASIRGTATEEQAQRWHTSKVGVSYTR